MGKKRKKGQATRTRRGSASRFGPRYGAKHKKRIATLESTKRKQMCPVCGRKSLNKKGHVWICSKCKAQVAGGAYVPKTALGKIVDKILGKRLTKEQVVKITKEFEEVQEEEKTKKEEKPKKEKKVIKEKKETKKKVVKKKTTTKKEVKKKEE